MSATTYTAVLLTTWMCPGGVLPGPAASAEQGSDIQINAGNRCPDGKQAKAVEMKVLTGTAECHQAAQPKFDRGGISIDSPCRPRPDKIVEITVDGKVVLTLPATAVDADVMRALERSIGGPWRSP